MVTVRSAFAFAGQRKAAACGGNSPSAAAEAAVGPIPLFEVVVVRHYCCCVLEEEVLHVTRTGGLAAHRAPGRERHSLAAFFLSMMFQSACEIRCL